MTLEERANKIGLYNGRLIDWVIRVEELTAERDQFKYEWQAACTLVAEMHKAAVGEYRGCASGVVEDVADLKAERDALKAALERCENWFESQAKVVSKGCGSPFDLMMLRDERDACSKALKEK